MLIQYSTVVLYSGDRYEIIRLLKISHSIKQPCSSVCLKKVLEMHQKCLNNVVPLFNKTENRIFYSTASFKNVMPRPNFI